MKMYLALLSVLISGYSQALTISITSPASGTVFPSTQNSVTLNGTVSEAPSGTGSVVCTGNRTATFGTQSSTNWVRGWPLTTGLNTVTCVYTKGSETASATISFTKQASTPNPPANSAPNAVIGATPLSGPAPHNVALSSGSYDPDGTIVSHLWTYGDGTTSSTNAAHYHLFSQVGTYTITLRVTDNLGSWAEDTKVITVSAPSQNQNATVLGIDSDNDGIRDDVQSWIETSYASQPNVKLAAKKFAQSYQSAFANKDNKPNSIIATKALLKATNCLIETLKAQGVTIEASIKEKDKLKLLHTNTKDRIDAQKKINENFDGSSFEVLSLTEACN